MAPPRTALALTALALTALVALAGVTLAPALASPEGADQFGTVAALGWPLEPRPAVVRPFEEPATPFGRGHRGVDLAGAPGSPVFAAAAGTVVFASMLADRGVVSIQHPSGLRTTYEPVSATVSAGDLVERGGQIGTLAAGHQGCPVLACLHWGLKRGDQYFDPLLLLEQTPIRLKPLGGG